MAKKHDLVNFYYESYSNRGRNAASRRGHETPSNMASHLSKRIRVQNMIFDLDELFPLGHITQLAESAIYYSDVAIWAAPTGMRLPEALQILECDDLDDSIS